MSSISGIFFFSLPEIFSKTFNIKFVCGEGGKQWRRGWRKWIRNVSRPQKVHVDFVSGRGRCLTSLLFPFSPSSRGPRWYPRQYSRGLGLQSALIRVSLLRCLHNAVKAKPPLLRKPRLRAGIRRPTRLSHLGLPGRGGRSLPRVVLWAQTPVAYVGSKGSCL